MTTEGEIETLRKQAPSTSRVTGLRQRRAEQGLTRLDLYVHPDDHEAVKAVVRALTQQRSSNTTCAQTRTKPLQS